MNKTSRKKLEQEIISAVEGIFSHRSKKAVADIKKIIKSSSKIMTKKFNKSEKKHKLQSQRAQTKKKTNSGRPVSGKKVSA